jgi:hypothetical protein
MTATMIGPALYERLADRLRHALQYAEAARVMAEDALELLEATREEEDDGEPASEA